MPENSASIASIPTAKSQTTSWALALAAAVLPFLSELPIDFDRLAPLAVLPAVWLGRKIPAGSSSNQREGKIDRWLFTVAVTAAILSAALSPHLFPAFTHTASLAWVVAAVFLARRLSADSVSSRIVLGGITVGAALGCLAVWAGWKEGTPIGAFPYYGHGRLFGLHLMIGTMAALVWLSSTRPKTFERYAVLSAAVINCGGILWSGGRAPLVGFAAGLAAWWWAAGRGNRRMLAQNVAMVFSGGLLLSLLRWSPESYLGWWGAVARSAAATSVDELSSTRLSFWQVTWQEFLKAPLIGHGADGYRFIQPKQDGSQPHNWMLQALFDFGAVGGLAVAALLVRGAWRGLVEAPEQKGAQAIRVGAAGTFVACLVAGLLDGVFYHAVLLIPAALIGGVASGNTMSPRENSIKAGNRLNRGLAMSSLIVATLVLGIHSAVVRAFLAAPLPPSPHDLGPRLLRAFPSTTFGLTRWLNGWRSSYPEEVLTWAKWGQEHSDNPAELNVYVAVIQANRGNFAAADAEMQEALRKCHIRTKPKLLELQKAIATAEAAARSPK